MGWVWPFTSSQTTQSSPHETKAPSQTQQDVSLTNEQRSRIFGRSTSPDHNDASRQDQADAELDAFLKSFSAPESSASPATPEVLEITQSRSQTTQPQRTDHDRIRPDGTLNIHPSAIYPRTMSCRQAFDQAFYCQSLGGKFNDVYRFGHLKDCNEQWGAFWFCMRTRTLPKEEKEQRIREYYAERDERRKKECGSSEDVWDLRETPVQKAFWRDPDAVEEDVQVKE